MELSKAQHIITVDDFAPALVAELRGVFDERFKDPRQTHAQRFLWDYWYCPDAAGSCQYSLVRTQAQVYFSPEQHAQLVDTLLAWGEAQLGCRAITPLWLSYYTDGMLQELHADNPHGPFAFVLSLTTVSNPRRCHAAVEWEERQFCGGETQILRPMVLDYWQRPERGAGLEHRDLVTLVEPRFGRLTVFDPRFPHGVREVRGSRDPRQSRLVLHGWFTDPSPFCTGGLEAGQVTPQLDAAIAGALAVMQAGGDDNGEEEEEVHAGSHPCSGFLALRLHVAAESGKVQSVTFLADTLVPLPSVGLDVALVRSAVQEELSAWLGDCQFPAAMEDTVITVPVLFE
ncbi:hypothetical protein V8C86DRAFT_3013363 [Haematococcus lacustris]